jgi:hypothetical protein
MASRLNARIDAPLAKKVAALRLATRQTTTDVVRVALERYYDAVERESRPYELLRDGGFIGCADGPSDLSVTYKHELTRSLESKLGTPTARPDRVPRKPSSKKRSTRKAPR